MMHVLKPYFFLAVCTALCLFAGARGICDEISLQSSIPNPDRPTTWSRQVISPPLCAEPPIIDGILNDPCWKTAFHAVGFYRIATDLPVTQQTEAWICADKQNIYVAFHCIDSEPNRIVTLQTQRDGDDSKDDFVTVQIDSEGTGTGYSTFDLTPRGTQIGNIEGGTANNITWTGDWHGATHLTPNGWTAEFAIPFKLLRYPSGTNHIHIRLRRQLAREIPNTSWPGIPKTSEVDYQLRYAEWRGISPPSNAPKPVYLPYWLGTAGDGTSGQQGIDVKYPLSTTVTGLLAVHPEFAGVAQSIANLSFSYTQKYLADNRPFFSEASGFLPSSDLFYSTIIPTFDEGVRVTGKTGPTTIGMLGLIGHGAGSSNDVVLNYGREFGTLSNIGVAFVNNIVQGLPSNQVGQASGQYGTKIGTSILSMNALHEQSWVKDSPADGYDSYFASIQPTKGRVQVNYTYVDYGPKFISNIGYIPQVDFKGSSLNFQLSNQLDHGSVESYYCQLNPYTYQHHTGGFFENGLVIGGGPNFRSGWGISNYLTVGQYQLNHDHDDYSSITWNRKSLYDSGSIGYDFGRIDNQTYGDFTLSQGLLIVKQFSINTSYEQTLIGPTVSKLMIATANYRLSTTASINSQLVSRATDQSDLYIGYNYQARVGTDYFILFGDPNSIRTRGLITVKLTRAFQ